MNRIGILIAAWFLMLGSTAFAQPFSLDVLVNTQPLEGQSGFVAVDFLDGDGLASNQVVISGFSSDAFISDLVLTGDAAGTLVPGPLLLGDGVFVNTGLQQVIFGNWIEFRLDVSTEGPFVPFPDAFSLFLLDDAQRPFETSDPTGADALLVVEIAASEPTVRVFDSPFANLTLGSELVITDVRADPALLWPPNGKMVPVQLTVEIDGGGNSEDLCAIVNVSSNEEPIDNDFEITAPLALNLRAKRLGSGSGRIYTIEVGCQGGSATESTEVTVPHDQGSKRN